MNKVILVLAAMTAGCAPPVTELMVVVGSDLRVPDEIDTIEIQVTDPARAHGPVIATDPMLPVSLGIVHRAGPLGPVRVEVLALRDGVPVLSRAIETEFVEGEVREVRLDLVRACVAIECPGRETCVVGECVSIVVPGEDLPPWQGERDLDAAPADAVVDAGGADTSELDAGGMDVGRSDAGNDGGAPDVPLPDVPAPDVPTIDAPIDVPAPIDAGCSCALDHAVARCSPSGCAIDACETGWSDCDGMAATGCERSIRTVTDCAGCDRRCMAPMASTSCGDGTCRITECTDDRRADCNGSITDGCETRIEDDDDHCGACGVECTAPERCRMFECRR